MSREPDRFWTWLGALTAAWCVSAAILLASGILMEKLGPRALRALARLTGMLLIMMAVQMLMDGVTAYIGDLRIG
jgi:multiple antibiotic resistance protein